MVAICALAPVAAWAHVERPSYWPDPAPDCSISPCTGGAVPQARTLASALDPSATSTTRVVCQPDSLTRAEDSIAKAQTDGYDIRPTDHRVLGAAEAADLLSINQQLFAMCQYSEIQPAINASGNNDRVVIMPGLYTEPTSRAVPDYSPQCAQYFTTSDGGDPGALSHAYQYYCPNDANLVAVIGRGLGPGQDPSPPLEDRHGIPNLGPCIRCNLQVEGSGVSADDVVIEAGDASAGNGGPSGAGDAKHVGFYVDQADGFVLRNVTVRHAGEHDIYVMESDGYLLDGVKAYYAGGYGILTFVEDHGLIENCDVAGNGDSGIYPGAGAKTSAGADTSFYPDAPRYSQEIRDCDSHHNTGGYSGTNGNATHVDHDNFFDNALGFTTDVFTAPGHPGFPQQGDLIEDNNFYDNNFNPYVAGSDVRPYIPAPVGTGLWIAGGNDNMLRGNHFYDNYRRGVMLFSSPDVFVCGPVVGSSTPVPGCDPTKVSTSYNNSFTENIMGVAPDGRVAPNGTDFWWDDFPGNTGNCWWGNIPAPGASITTSPLVLPDCLGGTHPELSIGTGYAPNEAELTGCLVGFQTGGYPQGDPNLCDWTKSPSKPSGSPIPSTAAGSAIARERQAEFMRLCNSMPQSRTCAPFVPGGFAPFAMPRASTPQVSFKGRWAQRPLGLYTCGDWKSRPALRTRLLARLAHFTGGAIEGDTLVGYGTVLPRNRAAALFATQCRPRYAKSFALYKLYGAAAGFAGVAP